MKQVLIVSTLAALMLGTPEAQADFVIKGWLPVAQATGPAVMADDPHTDPGDRQPAPVVRPMIARLRLVAGFGENVPLAFACRQIVPASIKVSFGQGADRQMLVTWKGGNTWPLVLGQAIQPLGLHMVSHGMNLTIEH